MGDTFHYTVNGYQIAELESMLGLKRPYKSNEVVKKVETLFLLITKMKHPELHKRAQFLYEVRQKLILNVENNTTTSLDAHHAVAARRDQSPSSVFARRIVSRDGELFRVENKEQEKLQEQVKLVQSEEEKKNHELRVRQLQTQEHQWRIKRTPKATMDGHLFGRKTFSPGIMEPEIHTQISPVDSKEEIYSIGPPFQNNIPPNRPYVAPALTEMAGALITPPELNKLSIMVDTRFRDNILTTSSNDFNITLDSKIKNVIAMQMSSYEFPLTFYAISRAYGNNTFKISITYFPADSLTTLTIEQIIVVEDGNYIAGDLRTKLNEIFAAIAVTTSNTIWSQIEVSLDLNSFGTGTGKITIAISTSTLTVESMQLFFNCDEDGNTTNEALTTRFGYLIGFQKPFYAESNIISYTGDSIADTSGQRYFFISVEDFNVSANKPFLSGMSNISTINSKHVMARIQVKGTFFDLILENDANAFSIRRKYKNPVEISKLRISCLDDHGRPLHLNNGNFSFCLDVYFYD